MFTACIGWTMSRTSCCTTALRRHSQRTMMNSAQLHSEFSEDLMTQSSVATRTRRVHLVRYHSKVGNQSATPLDSGSLPDRVPVSRRCSAFRDARRMCSGGTAEAHFLRYAAGHATKYGKALTDTERHSVRRCMCVEGGRLQHHRWSWFWFGKPCLSTARNRSLIVLHRLKLSKMSPCTCIVAIHRICTSTFTVGFELTLSGGVSMRAALAATSPRRPCLPQCRCCTSTSHATNSLGSGW